MNLSFGQQMRAKIAENVAQESVAPFIGVYDVFSATLAARHYDALFLSGFGFAASYYGLPDIGFIAWPDMVSLVGRVRAVLPQHHILVDIDDGYCDVEVACHVVSLMENAGASGVVLEDQQRPRRCGHFDGKQIMPLDEYLEKLDRVLEARREMFVVARTDSSDRDDILERARAFDRAGADAILVDGLADFELIRTLKKEVSKPLVFNQIAGGKSPRGTLKTLAEAGISLAIYSTPCLFAAQSAIDNALCDLKNRDGLLPDANRAEIVGVRDCTQILQQNLERKHVK